MNHPTQLHSLEMVFWVIEIYVTRLNEYEEPMH